MGTKPQGEPATQINNALDLAQVNRSISRVDSEEASAAVQLSSNIISTNLADRAYGKIEIDVSIPGMKVKVGRKIAWNGEFNASVSRLQSPSGAQR